MDTYLTELHQQGKLNGNVLVLKDGKTLYEKSFGYADGNKTHPLTKDYRFNVGSVYKEFPATSIMQLHEQNLLQLDDPVSTYISGLPKWSNRVTITNLLQYASGLPTINWGAYFSKGLPVTDQTILDELKGIQTLQFEPGTDYLYSNSNPFLLIQIIEAVTNMPYIDYVQQHLLTPYGMKGAVIETQYPYPDNTHMALPFNAAFEEDQFNLQVSGLLFSGTARGIANWFQHLDTFQVVSKESVQLLSKTAKEGDNIQSPLGYTQWNNNTLVEHTHHGSSGNYECIVQHYKQDGITIVVLTNQKHGNVHDIAATLYQMAQ